MPTNIEDRAGIQDFVDALGRTQWVDDAGNILGTIAAGTTSSSTALVSSAPTGSTFGSPITFTATVTPTTTMPTGTVTFNDGGSPMSGTSTVNLVAGGNTATFTISSLISGSHSITATYNGDSIYASSTSTVLTQSVTGGGLATSTTVVASSSQPVISGVPMTFTATITPTSPMPTGTVQFFANGILLGGASTITVDVTGHAVFPVTFITAPATYTITATYSGDVNYNASTSVGITQDVLVVPPLPQGINKSLRLHR